MAKSTSIKRNFVMNALLTMSTFIFPLITFPYVSRILGPLGTGKVSLATSVVSYFTMFAQLGIPTYGVRRCAQVRDDKMELTRVTHELLFINFMMSVVAYVILFFALAFVPRLQGDRTLYLIISLNIIFTCIGIEWMYRGLEEYTYITVRSIIFKFIALVAMFAFIHQKSDYLVYGGISIFAASASSILNFINARKHIYMRPVGGYKLRRHLKPVLIFFAMSIATTVYTNLDTVMLGFMKTDTDVGYYNAAVKIKGILVSIVTSLGAVLLPRASYYVEKGDLADLRRLSSKALDFVLVVACPLALYFILFAKEGIRFLSGPAYGGAILPMQWIQPTIIFIGLTNILGLQILVPLGKEKYVLYSEIAGAVTDFGINMLLIPRLASTGASIGTLAAEFVVLVVQYHVLRKEVAPIFRELPYGKVVVALGLASLASLWTKRLSVHAFIILVISVVLFMGIYALFLFITKEPMMQEIVATLKNKLKRSRSN